MESVSLYHSGQLKEALLLVTEHHISLSWVIYTPREKEQIGREVGRE